jgi:hypothetical protein
LLGGAGDDIPSWFSGSAVARVNKLTSIDSYMAGRTNLRDVTVQPLATADLQILDPEEQPSWSAQVPGGGTRLIPRKPFPPATTSFLEAISRESTQWIQ